MNLEGAFTAPKISRLLMSIYGKIHAEKIRNLGRNLNCNMQSGQKDGLTDMLAERVMTE